MTDHADVEHVIGHERSLLDPVVRRTPEVVGRWARRTSLWRRTPSGAWQIFLHQGTLAPDLG